LLNKRLLTRGGSSHGFIHVASGLFAGITLALVAILKIPKIILENFRASLAEASSGGLVQRRFGFLLGRSVRVLPVLHDRGVSAPIVLALPVALSLHLLVQRINEEVVSPQNKHDSHGPQNHEPLEHGAETPSPKFILADFSRPQAARQSNGVHEYLDRANAKVEHAHRWAAGADTYLPVYWTFCQFSQPQPGGNLELSQSKKVRL
jgi:hypothetical protein